MTSVTRAKIDVYENVTDRIIEQLEKGTVPWRKTWAGLNGMPKNLTSKKHYRGINVFLLALSPYSSPYWLTFKQAKDLGGSVKKGEKSTLVVFWKLLETVDKESGLPVSIPILRHYRVFNSEQCELGDKAPESVLPSYDHDSIEACETVVDGMPNGPEIEHVGGQPLYYPELDKITIPEQCRFETAESYYATLFHELTHSTGHENRLNRPGITEDVGRGSSAYGQEELVAEMGAAFLCAQTGIETATIESTASYIAGWLKILRKDKRLVVQAAGKAQQAVDFILGRKFDESEGEQKTKPADSVS